MAMLLTVIVCSLSSSPCSSIALQKVTEENSSAVVCPGFNTVS